MNERYHFFHSFCYFFYYLLFLEYTPLDADEDVLVAASGNDVVSYDVFGVLLCTHSQVAKVTVGGQLFKSTLCFHDEIGDEGANLDSWKIVWEKFDGYSIEIDQYVSNRSWLSH